MPPIKPFRAADGALRSRNRWHAVSIVSNKLTCEAAQAQRAQRHLSKDAPPLPLPDCSMPGGCRCMYKHHNDRRAAAPRRRDDYMGLRRNSQVSQERRAEPGRRGSDH